MVVGSPCGELAEVMVVLLLVDFMDAALFPLLFLDGLGRLDLSETDAFVTKFLELCRESDELFVFDGVEAEAEAVMEEPDEFAPYPGEGVLFSLLLSFSFSFSFSLLLSDFLLKD